MEKRIAKKELLISIYGKYKKSMYYVAYGILKDKQSSEDMIQDSIIAFESKYELLSSMDEKEISNYVHRTIKNKSLNHLKRSKKMIPIDFTDYIYKHDEVEYDISLSLIEDEFINSAKDYLIQVSEQQAEVFMYKFYYDYSNEEIASLMGISHNYARVLVYRAKNNIKDFIEKWRIYEQKNIQ